MPKLCTGSISPDGIRARFFFFWASISAWRGSSVQVRGVTLRTQPLARKCIAHSWMHSFSSCACSRIDVAYFWFHGFDDSVLDWFYKTISRLPSTCFSPRQAFSSSLLLPAACFYLQQAFTSRRLLTASAASGFQNLLYKACRLP